MTQLIDGKVIAESIKEKIKLEVQSLNPPPRLDVILVGNNDASEIYVKKKGEACSEVGFNFQCHHLKESEQYKLFRLVENLNIDYKTNGILVQLPLPEGWDCNRIFGLINPNKDVDVFHPENIGLLVQNEPRFLPPTPRAVQQIFEWSKLSLVGKHVVIINRSLVVGKPLSSMLIQDNGVYANATVTVCHNNTPPEILKQICLSADIIIVAVGIPGFLTEDMVTKSQVIIDVGITRVGKKIFGDVHPAVLQKVAYATPVPGGVGPVTVACLLQNVLEARKFYYE